MNRKPRIFGVKNYKGKIYWFAEIKGYKKRNGGLNNEEKSMLTKADLFCDQINSKTRHSL